MIMRRALRGLAASAAVAAGIGLPLPATANPDRGAVGGGGKEIEAERDRLVFLAAPAGKYIAVVPDLESGLVYYGDGRDLHRQRVLLSAAGEDDGLSVVLWAPRLSTDAAIELDGENWFLRCGPSRTPLPAVGDDERNLLLKTARFHRPRLRQVPYALARDRRGEYYYLDRLTGSRGAEGFRLFVGRVGKARPAPLTWVVSDSEGDVFATRRGELRISTAASGERTFEWRRGSRRELLLPVPPAQNSYLIYKELGVYENQALGSPCD